MKEYDIRYRHENGKAYLMSIHNTLQEAIEIIEEYAGLAGMDVTWGHKWGSFWFIRNIDFPYYIHELNMETETKV